MHHTIMRAQSGNKEAFCELVSTYYQTVQRFAFQIGVTSEEVEDVTQEVFLKVYRSLDSYEGGTFTTWLYAITLNTARDMMRKQQRQRRKMEKLKQKHNSKTYSTLDVSEEAMELHELIQELDVKYRVPLVLHYFHHLTYREISEVTNTSESGIKTQVMRAKKQLKAKLEKEGGQA